MPPAPDAAVERLEAPHLALRQAYESARVATQTAREAGDTAEYYRGKANAAYWEARRAGWSDRDLATDGLHLLPVVTFRMVPVSTPAPR